MAREICKLGDGFLFDYFLSTVWAGAAIFECGRRERKQTSKSGAAPANDQ
jgi:hypothetical protein